MIERGVAGRPRSLCGTRSRSAADAPACFTDTFATVPSRTCCSQRAMSPVEEEVLLLLAARTATAARRPGAAGLAIASLAARDRGASPRTPPRGAVLRRAAACWVREVSCILVVRRRARRGGKSLAAAETQRKICSLLLLLHTRVQ